MRSLHATTYEQPPIVATREKALEMTKIQHSQRWNLKKIKKTLTLFYVFYECWSSFHKIPCSAKQEAHLPHDHWLTTCKAKFNEDTNEHLLRGHSEELPSFLWQCPKYFLSSKIKIRSVPTVLSSAEYFQKASLPKIPLYIRPLSTPQVTTAM